MSNDNDSFLASEQIESIMSKRTEIKGKLLTLLAREKIGDTDAEKYSESMAEMWEISAKLGAYVEELAAMPLLSHADMFAPETEAEIVHWQANEKEFQATVSRIGILAERGRTL